MDILWDLHDVLDMEIHAGTVDTPKKDKEDNKQTNKVGNMFSMESTKLVNGYTFHWYSMCTLPWCSTAYSMVMHTNYSSSSTQNTNAQLLNFDAAAWTSISLSSTRSWPSQMLSHKPRLQHLSQPSKPSATLAEPHLSPTTMPHMMLLNQHSIQFHKYHPLWVQLISSN